jgi:hypothetical protein
MADWKYEDYSSWSKQLAKNYKKQELELQLLNIERELKKASDSHLRAINSTGSMQGCSQRRAQSRNNVVSFSEKKQALKDAIEILEVFHYAN